MALILWSWRSYSREERVQPRTGIIAQFLITWRALGKVSTPPHLGLLICDMGMMPMNEGCSIKWNNTFRELSNDSDTLQVFSTVSYFCKALVVFFKWKKYIFKFFEKKTFISADENFGSAGDHHCYHTEWTAFQAQAMTVTAFLTCAAHAAKMHDVSQVWRNTANTSQRLKSPKLGNHQRNLNTLILQKGDPGPERGRDLPQITQGERYKPWLLPPPQNRPTTPGSRRRRLWLSLPYG